MIKVKQLYIKTITKIKKHQYTSQEELMKDLLFLKKLLKFMKKTPQQQEEIIKTYYKQKKGVV